ncbi:putative sterigmatocystin biosynthesis peroxidase [Lachnellula suecica]|uniref:Putative sterigmatocystin biosynthesis peroxidase n=1 Tax=Lachnellula suecica TaxID=602035 RepID=A0A8T9BRS3_9HELO|nr:putative sterigmatocystin biosynthesis peroxidase [Lachnellula suecica]
MKQFVFSASLVFALASALPSANIHARYEGGSLDTWAPGGADDFRGPCPMMNTLANHAFLPHDGRNLTKETVIRALNLALGFAEDLGAIMFEQAVFVNPEPNATYFTLDQLNPHNVLEHDASLSRTDAFFGNNHVFNQTVFNTTLAYWPNEVITANDLANSKLFRQIVSRSTNPTYSFGANVEPFSIGEVSAPIIAFGDMEAGTCNKTFVTYFFENERLPVELGWSKQANGVSLAEIGYVSEVISNATNLLTTSAATASKRNLMRDIHSGMSC